MKKISTLFIIMILMLCATLSACKGSNDSDGHESNPDSSNKIHYSAEIGTKIEELSAEDQAQISRYVEDCKTWYINGYKNSSIETLVEAKENYVAITDVFVHDFKNCNIENPNSDDALILKTMKKLREDEVLPIMYIEFSGYATFMPGYKPMNLSELGVTRGYFIYEDGTFIGCDYSRLCQTTFIFKMPDGAALINCGDKYAEELNHNDLKKYDQTPTYLTYYE